MHVLENVICTSVGQTIRSDPPSKRTDSEAKLNKLLRRLFGRHRRHDRRRRSSYSLAPLAIPAHRPVGYPSGCPPAVKRGPPSGHEDSYLTVEGLVRWSFSFGHRRRRRRRCRRRAAASNGTPKPGAGRDSDNTCPSSLRLASPTKLRHPATTLCADPFRLFSVLVGGAQSQPPAIPFHRARRRVEEPPAARAFARQRDARVGRGRRRNGADRKTRGVCVRLEASVERARRGETQTRKEDGEGKHTVSVSPTEPSENENERKGRRRDTRGTKRRKAY